VYATYGSAQSDLVARIGGYCSYCERQIETHLAIEHVQPKSLVPAESLSWKNFLLSCVNCNSSKSDLPVVLADFLWPDTDNTLKALVYREGGFVEAADDLDPTYERKQRH